MLPVTFKRDMILCLDAANECKQPSEDHTDSSPNSWRIELNCSIKLNLLLWTSVLRGNDKNKNRIDAAQAKQHCVLSKYISGGNCLLAARLWSKVISFEFAGWRISSIFISFTHININCFADMFNGNRIGLKTCGFQRAASMQLFVCMCVCVCMCMRGKSHAALCNNSSSLVFCTYLLSVNWEHVSVFRGHFNQFAWYRELNGVRE